MNVCGKLYQSLKRRSTSSSEHEVSVGKQLKLDDEVEIYF